MATPFGNNKKMLDEGVNVIILLADWHAWVNDKFGRDMGKISLAADYMSEVFRALLDYPELGDGPGQVRFVRASGGHGFRKILGKGTTVLQEYESFKGQEDIQHYGEGMRIPPTTTYLLSIILLCRPLISLSWRLT